MSPTLCLSTEFRAGVDRRSPRGKESQIPRGFVSSLFFLFFFPFFFDKRIVASGDNTRYRYRGDWRDHLIWKCYNAFIELGKSARSNDLNYTWHVTNLSRYITYFLTFIFIFIRLILGYYFYLLWARYYFYPLNIRNPSKNSKLRRKFRRCFESFEVHTHRL